jgi:hypothetical protein
MMGWIWFAVTLLVFIGWPIWLAHDFYDYVQRG